MKKKILSNFNLKVSSLIIAVTLWVLVRGEQRTDIYVNVKVELKNMPNYLIVTAQNSDRISIRLNGPKEMISKLDDKYFKPYVIDLSGSAPGEQTFKVLHSSFKVENNIQIAEISPREIKLELDMLVKKDVPLEPSFTGQLEHGYEIEGYDVYPESVKLMGPRSQLLNVNLVKTAPIDLLGRKRSFVDKYPIVLDGKNIWVEGETELVLVNIRIREEQVTRIIKDVPVRLKGKTAPWDIETKFVNVKIAGPAGKVNEIKKEELDAIAEASTGDLARVGSGDKTEWKVTVTEIPGVTVSSLNKVIAVKK